MIFLPRIVLLFLLITLPTLLSARIKHPIKIPNFDDNDTIEDFSIEGSLTHFFDNPNTYSARPDGSGRAYNRYDLDLYAERNTLFIECELTALSDATSSRPMSALSELDKDVTLGWHLSDHLDLSIEYEHDAPFNRSMSRSYSGVTLHTEYDGILGESGFSLFAEAQYVTSHHNYFARPDGTGHPSMFYTFHFDYDLPDNFSLTTENLIITDGENRSALCGLSRASEWDRILQLNYQATPQWIASLYQEVDTTLDRHAPPQSYWAFQITYEF